MPSPRLPPPDPHESLGMAPQGEMALPRPTAVFVNGRPSPGVERTCDAILDLRPGALIVVACE